MRRMLLWLLAGLALGGAADGCGQSSRRSASSGAAHAGVSPRQSANAVATKNTARLGGADPAIDAAAVAEAVYPGLTPATRPQAVVLVDEGNWPAAIAAAALASAPLGAPLLYAHGDQVPPATVSALRALNPLGAASLGGAQVIRIATKADVPAGYRTSTVSASGPAPSAQAAVERLVVSAQRRRPRQVILLAGGAARALQMPAAGLAAESGAAILWTGDAGIPAPTAAALASLGKPAIYLVGAPAVRPATIAALAAYGKVVRIASPEGKSGPGAAGAGGASDPVSNAVAVSRFSDGPFGWGIHEAGHGLAFANASRPLDAPAAAPLSAHGDYAPLLLLAHADSVPPVLTHYLSDIEPGYTAAVGPVREVYNHGWLIGDQRAISARVQAEIDAVLEVAPRTPGVGQPPPAPE